MTDYPPGPIGAAQRAADAREQRRAEGYAERVNAPVRPETIAAINERLENGNVPIRKVRPRRLLLDQHSDASLVELYERAKQAEAALARVRALHQPTQGLGYDSDEDDTPGSYGVIEQACRTCGTPDEYAIRWPCDTVLALTEPKEPTP